MSRLASLFTRRQNDSKDISSHPSSITDVIDLASRISHLHPLPSTLVSKRQEQKFIQQEWSRRFFRKEEKQNRVTSTTANLRAGRASAGVSLSPVYVVGAFGFLCISDACCINVKSPSSHGNYHRLLRIRLTICLDDRKRAGEGNGEDVAVVWVGRRSGIEYVECLFCHRQPSTPLLIYTISLLLSFSLSPPRASSITTQESDSDSENAPLVTLLPPRRPGSATSLSSRTGSAGSLASSSRANPTPKPKPLIDIAALTAATHLYHYPPPPPPSLLPLPLPPQAAKPSTGAHQATSSRRASDLASGADRDSVLANDLAALLAGGIALVNVGLDEEDAAGEELLDGAAGGGETKTRVEEKDRGGGNVVPPIVIKQRSPSPTFSVTSRPAHAGKRSIGAAVELGGSSGRGGMALQTRERQSISSTLTARAGTEDLSAATSAAALRSPPPRMSPGALVERASESRQRSATMTPLVHKSQQKTSTPTPRSSALPPPDATTPSTSPSPSSSSRANLAPPSLRTVASNSSLSSSSSNPRSGATAPPPPPHRPFVSSGRLSPTSSTGELSSDPALLTSWDWSDTGGSSGEERGRWRGGDCELVTRRGGVRRTSLISSDGVAGD
ncbi:hypothetical protein R3P38DRAFT_3245855 [Favolaschia claudopus]|uniref:Uncharacterized protein n=1 Tax=Favolaschia claudopus TaxID=2862362 RepID=A0AAV9YZV8_9AGAR